MSMFLLSKTLISRLDKHRRRFFWQVTKNRKRYYLVKWTRICRSKSKGGLGVKDLHKQNLSLLTKWWWKLETKSGLWQHIVKAKYFRRDFVASIKGKINDSPCWKAIMKVKELYMVGRQVSIQSGDIARLWMDPIGDQLPFKEQFPWLFSICNYPDCTIKSSLVADPSSFFRRRLNHELEDQ